MTPLRHWIQAASVVQLANAYLAVERRWLLRIGGWLLLFSLAWALLGLTSAGPGAR